MQYNAGKYNTVQYCAAQFSVLQYTAAYHNAVDNMMYCSPLLTTIALHWAAGKAASQGRAAAAAAGREEGQTWEMSKGLHMQWF